MALDHIGIPVSDYTRSKAFYENTLAPLGYELVMEFDGRFAGFGEDGRPDFWISSGSLGDGIHLAFTVGARETVDAFHAAALDAGGTDNGKPGLRPEYHANYYGAFVLDPDGHNIEAVCHR